MIQVRKGGERGHAQHGWLESYHTYSFADYYDARHMGFRVLRVINEDRVQPGQGFAAHSHRDMEIVSYVLDGSLEHRDSLGNGSVIRPGEVQRMSAGTGVTHSEYNPSDRELVHFLQIWLLPERTGIEPSYEQRAFSAEERRDRFRLVVSPDGRDGSLRIHQNAEIHASLLGAGAVAEHALADGRHAWVQLARGAATVNGERLEAGDGAALSGVDRVAVRAESAAELLLFDLP